MSSPTPVQVLTALLRSKEYRMGEQVPGPKELSRRLSLPLAQVAAALAQLVADGDVSQVGELYFLGSWGTITAPGFRRSRALQHSLGEYYCLREEYPTRSPLVNCVAISSNAMLGGPVHAHDFCELVIVRDGAALHSHADIRYPIYTGDCFAIVPGQSHSLSHSNRLTISNVMFMSDDLARYAPQLEQMPGYATLFDLARPTKVHLDLPRQREAHTLIERISAAIASEQPGGCLEAFTYMVQLLILVCRAAEARQTSACERTRTTPGDGIVEKVSAFLEEHYAEELPVTAVAREAFLSVSRLQHLFKQTTGLTIREYQTGLRVGEACRQLVASEAPLSRIAADLGFRDQSYFAEVFGRSLGMTPSAYRRRFSRRMPVLSDS